MQLQIIHRPHPPKVQTRKPRALPVHVCAADTAERVCHRVAAGDRGALTPARELVGAGEPGDVAVFEDEVGAEHGGGDFAAVGAVAEVVLGFVYG